MYACAVLHTQAWVVVWRGAHEIRAWATQHGPLFLAAILLNMGTETNFIRLREIVRLNQSNGFVSFCLKLNISSPCQHIWADE